jgi:hypothetical protein
VNASIRLSLALAAVLAVLQTACAASTPDAGAPRTYRESASAAEATLRSGQESPTVLRDTQHFPHVRGGRPAAAGHAVR